MTAQTGRSAAEHTNSNDPFCKIVWINVNYYYLHPSITRTQLHPEISKLCWNALISYFLFLFLTFRTPWETSSSILSGSEAASFLLGSEGGKKKKKISNSLRARKRLKKKFFMDSQSYNKIKEDSKAASEPEWIEEEVSHGFWRSEREIRRAF